MRASCRSDLARRQSAVLQDRRPRPALGRGLQRHQQLALANPVAALHRHATAALPASLSRAWRLPACRLKCRPGCNAAANASACRARPAWAAPWAGLSGSRADRISGVRASSMKMLSASSTMANTRPRSRPSSAGPLAAPRRSSTGCSAPSCTSPPRAWVAVARPSSCSSFCSANASPSSSSLSACSTRSARLPVSAGQAAGSISKALPTSASHSSAPGRPHSRSHQRTWRSSQGPGSHRRPAALVAHQQIRVAVVVDVACSQAVGREAAQAVAQGAAAAGLLSAAYLCASRPLGCPHRITALTR